MPTQPTWPHRLPYEKGDPIPPGYQIEKRSKRGLLITGGTLFGLAYGGSLVAAASDGSDLGWLVVPIVGPFVTLFKQDLSCDADPNQPAMMERTCSEQAFSSGRRVALLLVDGLVQVTGAALLLAGLTSSEQQLVREPGVVVRPEVGWGTYGVRLNGSF